MTRPGAWLRRIAALVVTRRSMERLIDPIVADMQAEYEQASSAGRRWRASWVRIAGYAGFWKAVGLHALVSTPRTVASAIADEEVALGRTLGYAFAAFTVVTLLLVALPIDHLFSRAHDWKIVPLLLPQAMSLSIPIALAVAIACGVKTTRVTARRIGAVLLLAGIASVLTFAAVLMLPRANQAFRVEMSHELGLHDVTKDTLPRGPNELSLTELAAKIGTPDGAVPDVARGYRWIYHLRIALSVAAVALGLFAVAVCATLRARGWRVVTILLAIGAYWAMLAEAQSASAVPVALSAWTPNVCFSAVSLALLARARIPQRTPGTENISR